MALPQRLSLITIALLLDMLEILCLLQLMSLTLIKRVQFYPLPFLRGPYDSLGNVCNFRYTLP